MAELRHILNSLVSGLSVLLVDALFRDNDPLPPSRVRFGSRLISTIPKLSQTIGKKYSRKFEDFGNFVGFKISSSFCSGDVH